MWINKYNLPANDLFLFALFLSSSLLSSSSDSSESSDEAADDPTVASATGGSDRLLPVNTTTPVFLATFLAPDDILFIGNWLLGFEIDWFVLAYVTCVVPTLPFENLKFTGKLTG